MKKLGGEQFLPEIVSPLRIRSIFFNKGKSEIFFGGQIFFGDSKVVYFVVEKA